MDSEFRPLRVVFFPFMAQGHMIPLIDIARLFSSHGVHSTVITTPVNATNISKTLDKSTPSGVQINVKTIPFPAAEVGLPEGCEIIDMLPQPNQFSQFFQATNLLQQPLEQLLEELKPDYLISDVFFPWTSDSADKFNIPRIVFQGTSFFAMCAMESLIVHKPYKLATSDSDQFLIPDLPDKISVTRTMFAAEAWEDNETVPGKMLKDAREAGLRSFGVVVNSFYELEAAYAEHYKNLLNTRAWCIGPVSLWNRNADAIAVRGKLAAIDDHECLKWLDERKPYSVVYVCFGSRASFPDAQLRDIACGLEDSRQNFVWVIRRGSEQGSEDYLPEGFEDRVKDRGLLIRGWAPQVLILDHPSVGGFVTHCGWNSTLEGVSAGLPLVTWPLFAEQFFNEKLITDVLKLGVGVGVKKLSRNGEDHVSKDRVEKAVRAIMEGEEAAERQKRAREFGRLAKKAAEKDGSSRIELNKLFEDLKSMRET